MLLTHNLRKTTGHRAFAFALLGLFAIASGCSERAAEETPLRYENYENPEADAAAMRSPADSQGLPAPSPAPLDPPQIARAESLPKFAPSAKAPTMTKAPQPQAMSVPKAGSAAASSDVVTSQAQRIEYSIAPAEQVAAEPSAHLQRLPAGAEHDAEAGFATVEVFYATDRKRTDVPLSSYQISGQKTAFMMFAAVAIGLALLGLYQLVRGRGRMAAVSMVASCLVGVLASGWIALGQANIEKQGVTYSGDRGTLVRGICEVTVPDTHQRGLVERPSLLRFELREDQTKHMVLTSATELAADDFRQRLSDRVASAPESDLLVFIHGYNVDFESAVQRTAQIAVDLPFEGVPVCYSWPSQASLVGYTIDENNSEWTIAHLKEFLLELVHESGAKSVNVVAHSMGNRPMTAVMQQIGWEMAQATALFDRIVLAAPDVDADRFRRDLAPSLLKVANQVTLYASSDDQALIASKKVHGHPRAGESGDQIVVVPGIETIDVSGIDLSLLGHSYYGDNETMLRDLYELVRQRLPAPQRAMLIARQAGELVYWQLAQQQGAAIR
ncbi:alpha/beta hydrolase [Rosistilla oblonga]|uniref:alpha/beta hydrolase n=1 Tax=Rosistilla oblonga TaxID=2527990 RepID=UPI003A9720C2